MIWFWALTKTCLIYSSVLVSRVQAGGWAGPCSGVDHSIKVTSTKKLPTMGGTKTKNVEIRNRNKEMEMVVIHLIGNVKRTGERKWLRREITSQTAAENEELKA